jgi:hypothetical protein
LYSKFPVIRNWNLLKYIKKSMEEKVKEVQALTTKVRENDIKILGNQSLG